MKAFCNNVEIPESEWDKYKFKNFLTGGNVEIEPKTNIDLILELKQKLAETDYKAIKYAEGEITPADYAPIRATRQEWRRLINELEES